MAGTNYKRIFCSVDGCDAAHLAKGLCRLHYMQNERGGVRPDAKVCVHCAEPIENPIRCTMYCSKRCKRSAWRLANPDRDQAHQERAAQAEIARRASYCRVYFNTCKVCGIGWAGQRLARHCSDECKKTENNQLSLARNLGKHAMRPPKQCQVCREQFSAPYGTKARAYCGDICRAAASRATKAAAKQVREALKRGVDAERFNPADVFERDAWTCQLCGTPTPQEARGSYRSDAPELDHCVPVEIGRAHV